MKINLLKELIEGYKKHIINRDISPIEYHWETYSNFIESWDLEAIDLSGMFEKSFHSKMSLRLWKHENYYPKEAMLRFIEQDKEFVRVMFMDLFYGKSDLNLRTNKFLHYCDEMTRIIQKKNKKFDQHYHQNHEMIFVYLSFIEPINYTFLNESAFNKFMTKLEAKSLPRSFEPEYFVRMINAVRKFLFQDEEFATQLEQKLSHLNLMHYSSTFWLSDFIRISSR